MEVVHTKKKMLETAWTLKGRMDPCRASGRRDPIVASSKDSPVVSSHPSVVQVVAVPCSVADSSGDVDSGVVAGEQLVLDMGRARIRRDLGHRPCRLGHRTPVLYSRINSRTNIAPQDKKEGEEGTGKLAELLIMILEMGVQRVSCGSSSHVDNPAISMYFGQHRRPNHSCIAHHPGVSWKS